MRVPPLEEVPLVVPRAAVHLVAANLAHVLHTEPVQLRGRRPPRVSAGPPTRPRSRPPLTLYSQYGIGFPSHPSGTFFGL